MMDGAYYRVDGPNEDAPTACSGRERHPGFWDAPEDAIHGGKLEKHTINATSLSRERTPSCYLESHSLKRPPL